MNIMTIFTTSILLIIMLTGMSLMGYEAINKNPYLDSESVTIISNTNKTLNNGYTSKDYTIGDTQNSVTNGSSFTDVDAFARQYLEDKAEVNDKKGVLDKVKQMPNMVLMSMGVGQDSFIKVLIGFLVAALVLIISLALYKAIRTGETNG